MKIRRAVIGTTVLFSAGCWGPADLKDGFKADTAESDGNVMVDTGVVAQDSISGADTFVLADTVQGADTMTSADAGACYERPTDPTTLVGTACPTWEGAGECDDDGEIVVVCTDGVWVQGPLPVQEPGAGCTCSTEVEDCKPPTIICEPSGVGFLGVNVAGVRRSAQRSLRQRV